MPNPFSIRWTSVLFLSLFSVSCQATSVSASLPSGSPRPYKTGALIYQGVATAYGDAESISRILDEHQVTYDIVDSDQLNSMSLDDLSQYGVIIWPGGYAGQMSDSLTADTRGLIRQAVRQQGVSYVGICAGAFLAVSPNTTDAAGPDWGLALLDEPELPYYHLEDDGIEDAVVQVKFKNQNIRSLIWWGGPYLPESKFPHGVIARYDDTNEPAIAEAWAGNGLMILSGPHPEAPGDWRTKLDLDDPDTVQQDHAIAWKLFEAALNRQPLPADN